MPGSTRTTRPIPRLTEADERRFWSKVALPDAEGHLLWAAYLNAHGYGQFRIGGSAHYAHRVSYVIANGPIPVGMVLDHLCRTPACVAPLHLEAVTQAENMHRSMRDACKRGHALDALNPYIRPDNGIRQCRACAVVRRRKKAAS